MSLKIAYNHRRFVPLFWTQFFGTIALNIFRNALIILVTYRGVRIGGIDPNSIVVLSGGIFILPYFLFSATAGQLADKMDKSRLIRLIRLSDLLVMGLAAYGFYTDNFGLQLVVLFMLGLNATFFGPLKFGVIPELVGESELVSANGYIVASTFVAIVTGTIVGGIATTLEHVTPILIAATLGLSALGLCASLFLPSSGVRSPGLRVDWTLIKPTLEILGRIRRSTPIFQSIIGMSWFWFLGAALLTLFPVFAKDSLHAGKDVVIALMVLFSVGIGAGAVLCEKLSFRRVETGLIPIGAAGMCAALLDLAVTGFGWAPALETPAPLMRIGEFASLAAGWRIFLDVFLVALFGGLFIMPLYSFVQQRSRPGIISRVMAGNNILNALFGVAGAVFFSTLISLGVTVPAIFLMFVLLTLFFTLHLYARVPEFTLRFLSWLLVRVMYRIREDGMENLPDAGPAILLCNHASRIDWIILSGACKRPIRFVIDHRQARTALGEMLLRHGNTIHLPGGGGRPAAGENALAEVSRELENGGLIGIFPEGRPTADGEIGRFGPEIEEIIRSTSAPIVPAALSGLWGSVFSSARRDSILARLGRSRRLLVLKVGTPVISGKCDARKLETLVRAQFEEAERLGSQLTGQTRTGDGFCY